MTSTTIAVSMDTKEMLRQIGEKGESYDHIIRKLVEETGIKELGNRLNEIEKTIKEYRPFLNEKFKVKRIGIFGSYARGEEGKTSDVDILVNALKPELSDAILKEVVYA